jgi:peptidylprolyl isomerase
VSDSPSTRTPKRQRKKEGAQARRAAQVAALKRQQRNRRFVRVAVLAVIAVAAILLISWLGGDDESDVATDDTTTTTVAEESTTTTTAAPVPATPLTCSGPSGENTDMAAEPTVTVPDAPATELTCQDLVVGDGEEVLNTNDRVQVNYIGARQEDGEVFESSFGSEPATFGLDEVISGWTEGIPGMKVGGRRMLTIPADMAYGDDPSSGRPTGTLVFIIDLLAINPDA